MANSEHLQLDVVTPSGSVLSAQVDSVQAPSVQGEFGVLPNHLPLLAALKCGLLVWEVEGKRSIAAIGPGFVEGGPDKVLSADRPFRIARRDQARRGARRAREGRRGAQGFRRAVRRPGVQRAAAGRRLGARTARSLRRLPRRLVCGSFRLWSAYLLVAPLRGTDVPLSALLRGRSTTDENLSHTSLSLRSCGALDHGENLSHTSVGGAALAPTCRGLPGRRPARLRAWSGRRRSRPLPREARAPR